MYLLNAHNTSGIWVAALLFVNSFFSSDCMAFGVLNADITEHKNPSGLERPLIVNEDNDILGLFGGFSSGYNQNGDLERTMLLISSAGYVAPILNSGGIAAVAVSYFIDKDCIGQELQPVTMIASGFLPYRGMVFRALSTNDLAYIPKHARSIRMKTQSRLMLGRGGDNKCDNSIGEIEAYKVVRNQLETTGINVDNNYRFASVVVDGSRRAVELPSITPDAEAYEDVDQANEGSDIDRTQVECSPACLTNALGNSVCDIECYVESCYFDKGDCDNLATDVLQQKLSKVCSPGCDIDDIGDGFCDKPCDTQACQRDGGDCVQQ